jgi:PHP domain
MADRVAVDLHVHTALSPCGGDEMRAAELLLTAENRGVGVLGVVDHSTAQNAWAVVEAAQAFAVRVFVGLEIESQEGVHMLALFSEAKAAMEMDALVAPHLPPLRNRPDLFGEQFLLDEWGDVLGTDDRLLAAGTDLSVEEVAQMTAAQGGMCIAAHVDRLMNGLLPILGFVPPGLQVDALEVSRHLTRREARGRWPELAEHPLITASDAHYLDDVGGAITWVSPALAEAPVGAREWGRRLGQEMLRTGS